MRAGFPFENVCTGNTCFHYRDRVCSVHIFSYKINWLDDQFLLKLNTQPETPILNGL
jgi:hypothetical protein